jgi:hypothetical protein
MHRWLAIARPGSATVDHDWGSCLHSCLIPAKSSPFGQMKRRVAPMVYAKEKDLSVDTVERPKRRVISEWIIQSVSAANQVRLWSVCSEG